MITSVAKRMLSIFCYENIKVVSRSQVENWFCDHERASMSQ